MLSREAVVAAYRWILGREPEDEAAIQYHRGHADEAALREALVGSDEFAALRAAAGADPARRPPVYHLPPVQEVETRAQGEEARLLWERVARSWAEMGETRAHWSVLSVEMFEPERLEENRAAFEASAAMDLSLVDAALARFPDVDPAATECLELGCGVGRATRRLATRFARVHGLDVSANHLAIAEREIAGAGVGNVELRRMGSMEDYRTLPAAGFFYSRLVLQHNPPPVQAAVLAALLGCLAPGAVALFQVVTWIGDYRYRVAKDLRKSEGGMEMHVLPQPEVFRILLDAGFTPAEVQADDAAGDDPRFRTHLFLARRNRPAA